MIKITGLYKATSKKNETYLSGKTIYGFKYFVLKNNKTKDNQPDYNLYIEEVDVVAVLNCPSSSVIIICIWKKLML